MERGEKQHGEGGTRSKHTDSTTTAYFMSAKLQSANNRKDKVTGSREISYGT